MNFALSIAGFDPTGGAGVLADIKTFESHRIYGLGVSTALTFQSDNQFFDLRWHSLDLILQQIEPLKKFKISGIKIGIIENLSILDSLLDYLNAEFPNVPIVLDPVIKASAGYIFQKQLTNFYEIQKKVTVICPNLNEAKELTQHEDLESITKTLAKYSSLIITGIEEGVRIYDLVCSNGGQTKFFLEKNNSPKHGSGCVFSSAILANIVNKLSLEDSVTKAQAYTNKYLLSESGLLGRHYENK